MEKYHTIIYNGNWSAQPHVNRIRQEQASRTVEENDEAKERYIDRSYRMGYVLSVTSLIGSGLEAGQDQLQLDQIRHHAQSIVKDGTTMDKLNIDSLEKHSQRAFETFEMVQGKISDDDINVLKSENHCRHFEEGYGIVTNETHTTYPLNQAIVGLGGEMNFVPFYYLGLNAATAVIRYNKENNSIEMYYQASQSYRAYFDAKIPVHYNPYPSGLWITSVSDEYPVAEYDGRTDAYYFEEEPENRITLEWLKDSYLPIPVDYSVFDRGSEICDDDKRNDLDPVWEEAILEHQLDESANIFDKFASKKSMFQAAVEGMACGSSYMYSEYLTKSIRDGSLRVPSMDP